MGFHEAYAEFLEHHVQRRTGDRQARLKQGLGHGELTFLETVWWPAFKDFSNLHPEYEVRDFRDGSRYIDFAYIQSTFRIAIEIDGIGPHWRNISRSQFSDHCRRQNDLVIDGWYILRFAYVDIEERPRFCQQTLHQLLGKLTGKLDPRFQALDVVNREIVRVCARATSPVSPVQIARMLQMSRDTASKRLRSLAAERWLEPAGGSQRIRFYRLHPSCRNIPM